MSAGAIIIIAIAVSGVVMMRFRKPDSTETGIQDRGLVSRRCITSFTNITVQPGIEENIARFLALEANEIGFW